MQIRWEVEGEMRNGSNIKLSSLNIVIPRINDLTNKMIVNFGFSLWVGPIPQAKLFFTVNGSHFASLAHSQGRARKAERVGGPDEPGKLVWHSRVPCKGV